jgi:hypothetical protein
MGSFNAFANIHINYLFEIRAVISLFMNELHVWEHPRGGKMLVGTVEVECPYCKATYAYPTEQLVCPTWRTEVENIY